MKQEVHNRNRSPLEQKLDAIFLLKQLGQDLDLNRRLAVADGGIVLPSQSNHHLVELGEGEANGGTNRSRGSEAGQGQGSAGGAWAPRGSPTSTCSESSLVGELGLTVDEVGKLEGVARAYPQLEVRTTPNLLWLIILVQPVSGMNDTALLVAATPRNTLHTLASWAWWWPTLQWVGPRHTNYTPFPGSVCSFEPEDGTWKEGDSLITLLDLQTVWILRQLFLRRFGRWPGRQRLHTAWERLNEQQPGELCGGCDSGKRYKDCCYQKDMGIDPVLRLFLFKRWRGQGRQLARQARNIFDRFPPPCVVDYVHGRRHDPPAFPEIFCW